MTTREKIIHESLRLFSERGYNGVSMREIAAAVGIQGASLYHHFKGKEDIFKEIFQEMTKHYDRFAEKMALPNEAGTEATEAYLQMDEPMLLQVTEAIFSFFTQDQFVVMFRRLILSEQNQSAIAADCLREYYINAPLQFQTSILRGMLQSGAFCEADAETMALHFYSPLFFTLYQYDLGTDHQTCVEQLKKHVHWFCKIYKQDVDVLPTMAETGETY